MTDAQMKNFIIFLLVCLVVSSLTINIIESYRDWDSAIIKAERHHLITGEYYNTYTKVITITEADTTVDYILKEQATFEKTYWKDIIEKK